MHLEYVATRRHYRYRSYLFGYCWFKWFLTIFEKRGRAPSCINHISQTCKGKSYFNYCSPKVYGKFVWKIFYLDYIWIFIGINVCTPLNKILLPSLNLFFCRLTNRQKRHYSGSWCMIFWNCILETLWTKNNPLLKSSNDLNLYMVKTVVKISKANKVIRNWYQSINNHLLWHHIT